MNLRPIGVFDSGLGGLSAVKELLRILPHENIVYFGDTGRVPYGTRGRDTIIAYTKQDIAFLLSRKVKMVLAACGTASSAFPAEAAARLPVGYLGVVQPTAAAAAAATKNGRVGIIGTESTIASHSYQAALAALDAHIKTTAAACPLYVPLVENGHLGPKDALVALATKQYLAPLKDAGVDTLILGCTHYPLLAGPIAAYMGKGITLIDSGQWAALALKEQLARCGLLNESAAPGTLTCHVSDDPTRFERLGAIFLGRAPAQPAEYVDIEHYSL